jgi:putative DNA primase/helicase
MLSDNMGIPGAHIVEIAGDEAAASPAQIGELMEGAAALSGDSSPAEIEQVLGNLALAKLGLVGDRHVLAEIKRQTRLPLGLLANRLVDLRRSLGSPGEQHGVASGRTLELRDPEPWPEPIDGAMLLGEIVATIGRYVVLDQTQSDAVALWVLHTHAFDAAYVSPRVAITSPQKRCGKTTLLTLLSALVARSLSAANLTAATIFRVIEASRPTLLIDEADTFLRDSDEIRGVINAGHCRATATVLRTIEVRASGTTDYEVRVYSVWGPMAIASIGQLPGTIEDRSIKIALRRRRSDEAVERVRLDRLDELVPISRRAARWTADHFDALRAADPDVPSELHDRAADNWRPLLAIAEAAGKDWPERARRAAVTLTRDGADDAETALTLLLADLREMFGAMPPDPHADPPTPGRAAREVPFTNEILGDLVQREDRPWPEYRHGKQITPRQVASLLRPVGVKAGTVRRGVATAKGYRAGDMADAWARYLPSNQSVTPSQAAGFVALGGNPCVAPSRHVTEEKRRISSVSATCDGVTAQEPVSGDEEAIWTA